MENVINNEQGQQLKRVIKKGQYKLEGDESIHKAWLQDHDMVRKEADKVFLSTSDYLDIACTEKGKKPLPKGTVLKSLLEKEGLRLVADPKTGYPASTLNEFRMSSERIALLVDCCQLFYQERFLKGRSNPAVTLQIELPDGERAVGTVLDDMAGDPTRPFTDAPFGIEDEIFPEVFVRDVVGPMPTGIGIDYRQAHVDWADETDLSEDETTPTVVQPDVSFTLGKNEIKAVRRAISIKIEDSLMRSSVGAEAFVKFMSQVVAKREEDYVQRLLVTATNNIVTGNTPTAYTGNSNGVTANNFIRALRFLKGAYRANLVIGHEQAVLRFLVPSGNTAVREALALTERVTGVPRQLTLVNPLSRELRVIIVDDGVPNLTDSGNRNKLLFMNRQLGVGLYTQIDSAMDETDRDIRVGIENRVISRWDTPFIVESGRARAILEFS